MSQSEQANKLMYVANVIRERAVSMVAPQRRRDAMDAQLQRIKDLQPYLQQDDRYRGEPITDFPNNSDVVMAISTIGESTRIFYGKGTRPLILLDLSSQAGSGYCELAFSQQIFTGEIAYTDKPPRARHWLFTAPTHRQIQLVQELATFMEETFSPVAA